MSPSVGKRIHEFFELGVILKGLNAAIELSLGVLLLFVNVSALVQDLIADELVEDPTDFLANHLQPLVSQFSPQAQMYSALYLIAHGIIKGFLVIGLLRGKVWAYPASLAVLALFVAYQTIQILNTYSVGLILLTVFDLAVMWLIWEEYRRISVLKA
jgi:uncharacterized membrane protein